MQHRMTVGTHRAEVSDGINDVLAIQFGERTEVMDVDEAFNLRPVGQSKVKSADKTVGSVILDARPPRASVPFVGTYGDAHNGTLSILGAGVNLIRVGDLAETER